MYDSVNFYLEEDQFTLESEKFFDGKKTNKIDGRYDSETIFIKGIRENMINNKKYYPSVNLTYKTIGNKIIGKKKVRRLELQTSIPKTCYGTNKFETSSIVDQNLFLKRTNEYLKMAKVSIDVKRLENNSVLTGLAFPKSIILPAYFGTAEQVIKKIAPFDYKPRSKFRFREYGDEWEGIYIKLFNPTRGFGAYCKYSEILNKGYTLIEEEIKRQVLEGRQAKNEIRFELTSQKKQSLDAILSRFIPEKKKNFTLHDIFMHKDISQKLLLEQFDEVFNSINITLITLSEMKENKLDYLLRSKILNFKNRAEMFYLVNMTTKIGLRQTLRQTKQELSSSTFDRLKRELKEVIDELGELGEITPDLIGFLRSELVRFEPIKPVAQKISCQLLLNDI